jgi:phosphoribosyl-ATP pyrophosphohydrolase
MLVKPDKEVVWEAADLLFFALVGLENRGIDLQKVLEEVMSA